MLVSNEIERPVTVSIRSRRSRHGGSSTTIVAKGDRSSIKGKGSTSQPPAKNSKPKDKVGGGLLKKVFSRRA